MTPEQRADIERRDRSAVHGDEDSPEYMQAVRDRHALLDALVMAEQRANAYHDALADAHRETAEQAAEIVRLRTITVDRLDRAMQGADGVLWPESWRNEDFAWIARQVVATLAVIDPEPEDDRNWMLADER